MFLKELIIALTNGYPIAPDDVGDNFAGPVIYIKGDIQEDKLLRAAKIWRAKLGNLPVIWAPEPGTTQGFSVTYEPVLESEDVIELVDRVDDEPVTEVDEVI